MDEDSNDIFQKLGSIFDNPEMSDNIKNILNNISSSESKKDNASNDAEKSNDNSSIPNLDFETILKLKSIIDSFNNTENDSRSNLLLSLKPYVADNKKQKIDQYIKFLNLAKVIEIINPMGGDAKKNE